MNPISVIYDFLLIALDIYEILIFIYVIASWFGGLPKNRFGYFVYDMIAPLFRLVEKIPQPRGFLSFTALYALLAIWGLKAGIMFVFSSFL